VAGAVGSVLACVGFHAERPVVKSESGLAQSIVALSLLSISRESDPEALGEGSAAGGTSATIADTTSSSQWDLGSRTMSMASSPVVRVLLCDDHAVVREGLSRLLDGVDGIAVVGDAPDGEEAVARTLELRPDVVLMDLQMPRLDGVAATRRICAAAPEVRVVVLTSFGDNTRILDAIDAGARGYLLKDSEPSEVVRAVRAAARGEAPLDPRVARAVLADGAPSASTAGMTAREREVLALVGDGLQNKVIARRLGISEATVKAHLTRVFRQIGVTDRTQAAIWAREHGLTAS
jgi:DNA-binding NarL/FixJ family response regulator